MKILGAGVRYRAFISYTQRPSSQSREAAVDREIAGDLRMVLQRLGRPWHRLRRMMEVYVDRTDFVPGRSLPGEIKGKLESSNYLVVVISGGSGESNGWVEEETRIWFDELGRGIDQVILVDAEGRLQWDDNRQSPTVEAASFIPPRLLREVREQLLWVQLDPALEERKARVQDAAERVFAGIQGKSVAEVRKEEAKEARLFRTLWISLLSLALLASFAYGVRTWHERDVAQSREAAAEGQLERTIDPSVSRLLDVVAHNRSGAAKALSYLHALVTHDKPRSSAAVDGLLSSASMVPVTRRTDHTGQTLAVAISPDGTQAATGGADGMVSVWNVSDVTSPTRTHSFTATKDGDVSSLAWDGPAVLVVATYEAQAAVAGHDSGLTSFWDLSPATQQRVGKPIPAPSAPTSLTVADQGRTLAITSAQGIQTARLNGTTVTAGDAIDLKGATVAALTPNGRSLAVGTQAGVRQLSLASPLKPAVRVAEVPAVRAIAYTPDRRLVTAGLDGAIRIGAGKSEVVLGTPDPQFTDGLYALAVSPDGSRVAAGDQDGQVTVWDPTPDPSTGTGRALIVLPHPQSVQQLAFLGSSDELLTAGNDGQLRIWHLNRDIMLADQGQLSSAVWRPDGRLAATSGADSTVVLWDMTDRAHPRRVTTLPGRHQGSAQPVAFSPDGQLLAVPNDNSPQASIDVWNLKDPTHPAKMATIDWPDQGSVTTVAFGGTGRLLAAGGKSGVVRLWDVSDPAHPSRIGKDNHDQPGAVFSVAFAPDGQKLAVAGSDRTRLYSVKDPAGLKMLGDPIGQKAGEATLAVRFSPDGTQLATVGESGKAYLLHLNASGTHHTSSPSFETENIPMINIQFGPDGQLVTAQQDGSVRIWDTLGKKPVLKTRLTGQRHAVFSASFDPEGRYILSASKDGTAVLWDTDVNAVISEICRTAGDPPTKSEWKTLLPDRDVPSPCR